MDHTPGFVIRTLFTIVFLTCCLNSDAAPHFSCHSRLVQLEDLVKMSSDLCVDYKQFAASCSWRNISGISPDLNSSACTFKRYLRANEALMEELNHGSRNRSSSLREEFESFVDHLTCDSNSPLDVDYRINSHKFDQKCLALNVLQNLIKILKSEIRHECPNEKFDYNCYTC